ncbi:MAG: hypothetical protein PHF89_04395 [Eubacteriales bacterium]|jgi:hypothetical protein|nr:hypothetical protein [Eubacteriales bacterium]
MIKGIETAIIRSGFDKKHCYVHMRAGAFPDGLIIITTQKLLLSGIDRFEPLETMTSFDYGATWTQPTAEKGFSSRIDKDMEVLCCDFTPSFHARTKKMLGIGQTVRYKGESVARPSPRETAYAVYDRQNQCWGRWQTLEMPNQMKFYNCGAGCAQRVDLPSGDILLPFYFKKNNVFCSGVMRCIFDGDRLMYQTHGSELCEDESGRGIYEPSLTYYKEKYYLTLRADNCGYVSVSGDGLSYSKPIVWRWNDGTVLPNYNTQQHWVCHSDGLFLVYTRRGANNEHVFRHRAPLFMAQVDTKRLCLIKETERIIVPERGARLGNFGVTHISPYETIVTVSEWMQPVGCEKYNSDNAFFVTKIKWEKKNQYYCV